VAPASLRPDAGRGKWLTDLYQAHATAVHAYCRRFLQSPEDAADATHEVFLRALSSLQADPDSRQARGWLITVAQNYCLDLARRRRRMQLAYSTLAGDASSGHESETEIVNRQLLHAVLARLGERERQALWQSAVERRPLAEIATTLGLSYMAAAQLVHRARKHA
jgi:RNA polymerase sigma-70 factor (ECF subfamily)